MAGEELAYKMRGEKSVTNEVILMKWSPKMDVVALAFSDKSVSKVVIFIGVAMHFNVATPITRNFRRWC